MFCHTIPEHETAADIFKDINEYFESHHLEWEKLQGFCTDGAPAMLGRKKGLQKLIRDKAPNCKWTHCIIHREQLASKGLGPELACVLTKVVALVNFVKTSPLRARLFSKLCQELGSDHEVLLYHTEVRWLSRGNVLLRVFELRNELEVYFTQIKANKHLEFLFDRKNILLMSYLSDIFSKLNHLNTSLQGNDKTILNLSDKLFAFISKLQYWQHCVEKDNFTAFPTLKSLLEQGYRNEELIDIVSSHLKNLESSFNEYFSDFVVEKYDWIRNPFDVDYKDLNVDEHTLEELLELKHDRTTRTMFSAEALSDFWVRVKDVYPKSSHLALSVLVQFGTSYLCEKGFSSLIAIKTKYRGRLDISADMRCALSSTPPDMEKLCASKQAQVSH